MDSLLVCFRQSMFQMIWIAQRPTTALPLSRRKVVADLQFMMQWKLGRRQPFRRRGIGRSRATKIFGVDPWIYSELYYRTNTATSQPKF